jgi:hypothetical protein
MEGLTIKIIPYDTNQQYPKAVELINPLIECVNKRVDFGKKTSLKSIQLKVTLSATKHFLQMNDLKAAQLTLMKHGDISIDLKKIFYNNKKERSLACKIMCDFLEEMMRISK